MRFIKKILGKIVYGIAVANRFILRGLVYLIETRILLAKSFLKGCFLILSVGGCLFAFLLVMFLGEWLLSHPLVLLILILIIAFPILGAIIVGRIKDYEEVSSRFLFGRAEYLKNSDKQTKRSYQYHKGAYNAEKAEQARREWERRAREQRMWEERFRGWQGGFGGFGTGYGGAGSGYSSGTSSNPYVDFKSQYEKSCATLGIPVTTDESRIKLAYRKKAKQYHPDVNSASDATAQFQKINEAYEFLNEDNIRRYKSMSGPAS